MELGDYRVEVIPDTEFKLDGGAMFGVVPRVLWARVCPPDELNRITLNANCLFIETPTEKVLIETGMGEKWSSKEIAMYGIERKRPLADSLRRIAGCDPEDITIVINTHLHFDHAGGNTIRRKDAGTQAASLRDRNGPHGMDPAHTQPGSLRSGGAQFPNARYFVSKAELDHAEAPHERDRASYLTENWHPLIDGGQLELKPGSYEVVPGLRVEQVKGHSETMQTVRLDRGGKTLYGFFDMVPTRHHIPPAWIMSYDLYPTKTLDFKKRVLPQAMNENWICHFYHDTEMPLCTLAEVNGKISAIPLDN